MNLSGLKMAELREYAKQIGVAPQQHETRESLLTRIAIVTYPDQQPKQEPKPMKEVQKPVLNSVDDVMATLDWFIKKGGTVEINSQDKTWIAKYRGAENSGSMTMPLTAIKRHVEMYVARGALLPRIHKEGELAGALSV